MAIDFGKIVPEIDLENLIKTDKDTLTRALVGAGFSYFAANTIVENKTPDQLKDIIDDLFTAKLGRPLGEIVGAGDMSDFLGVGVMAYFEIGDAVADAVVKTEVSGEETVLTAGSKTAAKIALSGIALASQLINFDAIGGN